MKAGSVTRVDELSKSEAYLRELKSQYVKSGYFNVSVSRERHGWNIKLTLKSSEKSGDKDYKGRLFEDHIEEPRVFAAESEGRLVGWIELGYDTWNNRMRVWEFLVDREFRRRGIGTRLMNHAVEIAKERGARMMVLETQSNNVQAIDFYLRLGFSLIGLDVAAYSNDDVAKHEVRLEFGLKLQ